MKKLMSIFALILVCTLLFAGCSNKEEEKKTESSSKESVSSVDYSEYAFVNSWTRETEQDTETIRFGADGSFSYSCACGDPVNDADLCEGYTYDDETKTITLDCIEETEEMITEIKVVKCDDTELQLDFGGDIRVFTK